MNKNIFCKLLEVFFKQILEVAYMYIESIQNKLLNVHTWKLFTKKTRKKSEIEPIFMIHVENWFIFFISWRKKSKRIWRDIIKYMSRY